MKDCGKIFVFNFVKLFHDYVGFTLFTKDINE